MTCRALIFTPKLSSVHSDNILKNHLPEIYRKARLNEGLFHLKPPLVLRKKETKHPAEGISLLG